MSDKCVVPEFLSRAQRFGIDLSLDRMSELMKRLGHPQNDCKVLHVAGTNGKGSVVAYLSTILACADYKTGVYTSPYIERFSERMRIFDGKNAPMRFLEDPSYGEISADDLQIYSDLVKKAVKEMIEDGFEHPTEFELVTAVAFLYFSGHKCDYIVLETGLGGRFDATNIVAQPICSVITAIGFDHMDYLGETIGKIAFEKAGIIKEECPVYLTDLSVCGLSDADARSAKNVIQDICLLNHSPLFEIKNKDISLIHHDMKGQTFELSDGFFQEPMRLHTRMHGIHQLTNAALSVIALKDIVDLDVIIRGVFYTFWKARNEVMSERPLIIMDGAHNPQSMTCFRRTSDVLLSINHSSCFRLVFGMLKDKDVRATVETMFDHLAHEVLDVLCVTADHPRAMPADELAAICTEVLERKGMFYNPSVSMYNVQSIVRISKNIRDDCLDVFNQSQKDNVPILCTGSLYLVGQIRSIFIQSNKETQR